MTYVRNAKMYELDQVYLMGEDAWSNGSSIAKYLDECRKSQKYQRGQFKVLTDGKELLSSLIVYDLSEDRLGIGSIATPVKYRNNGYASRLVSLVTEQAIQADIFLFSDIASNFYEQLGFLQLPHHYQAYSDSICMLKTTRPLETWLKLGLDVPTYF